MSNYTDYRPMNGKNAIINGNMRIWERTTSITQNTSSNAVAYTADRFRTVNDGVDNTSEITTSQSTDVPLATFPYSMDITVDTASSMPNNSWCQVVQIIEGNNIIRLKNQTVTFSMWVKTNNPGTYTLVLSSSSYSNTYRTPITVSQADTWERHSVTLTIDSDNGTWNYDNDVGLQVMFIFGVGSSYPAQPANVWDTNGWAPVPGQTNLMASTGNYIRITGLQLELGGAATDFEHLDYQTQILLCRRYYYRLDSENGRVCTGWSYRTDTARGFVPHPIPLRTAPTVSYTLGYRWYDGQAGESYDVESLSIGGYYFGGPNSYDGSEFNVQTYTSNLNPGSGGMLFRASSPPYGVLEFDAEF